LANVRRIPQSPGSGNDATDILEPRAAGACRWLLGLGGEFVAGKRVLRIAVNGSHASFELAPIAGFQLPTTPMGTSDCMPSHLIAIGEKVFICPVR